MEALLPLIIQAVAGAAGGGVTANLVKSAAMGLLPKLLSGAVGGVGGGMALGPMIAGLLGGDTGTTALIGDAVGALIGGGVLTPIVGAVLGGAKKS